MAQNSNVPRSQEDYITKVSGETEGRVTKKLCQDVTTTESRILGAPLRLDEILLNASIQDHSGTAPETSRITLGSNLGTNEDNSQCDPILKRASLRVIALEILSQVMLATPSSRAAKGMPTGLTEVHFLRTLRTSSIVEA